MNGVKREFVTFPDGTVEERHTFSPEAWSRLSADLEHVRATSVGAEDLRAGAALASALMAANYGGDSGEDVDRLIEELLARGYRLARLVPAAANPLSSDLDRLLGSAARTVGRGREPVVTTQRIYRQPEWIRRARLGKLPAKVEGGIKR